MSHTRVTASSAATENEATNASRGLSRSTPGHDARASAPRTTSGKPQVNPVWSFSDGAQVLLGVKPDTSKYRKLRADPAVAISISGPERPMRDLEMRGTVTDSELFDNLSWVNQVARRYTGTDYDRGVDGEHRYTVVIRVESRTARG